MSTTLRRAMISVSALALTTGAAHADFTLDILHINDLHSRIQAINAYDSTCSQEEADAGECFGGVARVKTMIDERRDALTGEDANLLVLDAGDQFQGSLFYTTYKGDAEAEFMNAIGFDAMALGNHEFDDGPEGLDNFLQQVEVPVISGNTMAAEGSLLDGKYEPYLIKEFGEERVGILSVLATDTDETSSPGDDITFEDEIEYLTGAVEELEAEGINKIVLLSHVGYVRDQEIAAAVDGIDVIVGGHSHTLLSNSEEGAAGPYPTLVANPSGTEVPIVQAYAYSKYVGELRVEFDDDGVVTSATGDPHLLDNSVEPDEEVAARVEELAGPIEDLMQERVSDATGPIDGSRETCRAQECEMGNLVADAMLWKTEDQGVDIVIQNGGGLRASIDGGEITMGDVFGVLPFQNTLATFELTGANVVEALENGLSQYEEQAGRFAQVAGMRYTFDATQPAGERVVSVEVADGDGGFAPIDPEATYGVATNNYMRTGGDGYAIFESEGMDAYDYGPGLEQVVADYLRENEPYEPYLDGRIIDANAEGGSDAAAPAAEEMPAEEPADTADTPAAEDMSDEPAAAPVEEDMAEEPAMSGDDETAGETTEPAPADGAGTETEAPAAEEPASAMPPQQPAMSDETGDASEPADDSTMSDDAASEEGAVADPIEPAPMEEPMEASGEQTHTVVRGDTLWDLAEEFYGDPEMWRMIAEANPDYADGMLEIGAELMIPAK
ncbi:5'-nucleotidase C-terminal domain-containing protein [Pararhizobium haloflavum]|uniref:5'-nucleotidase C-terminal domain-containing protein n=1 Tax=Pararhizobium haloflavum TaxID=2037914 RepID=UPI000C1A4587|nr:5'-nucleotidase C-terminal domain-containing protein [Pararhizobium haloflavum]